MSADSPPPVGLPALPPPPTRRGERVRRALRAARAWARRHRALALVLAGVIAASLAAIAVGLAMGGRYPGPEPGTPAANDPEHVLVLCGVVVLGWFVIALITPFAYLFNVVTLGGLLLPFILLERVYLALWPPPVPTDPGPAWDPDPAHHYAALEADPRSSERLLRDAYRRQALRHHPDLGGDLETMQRLNTAWEVLGDPARRREYDRLAAPPRGAGAG